MGGVEEKPQRQEQQRTRIDFFWCHVKGRWARENSDEARPFVRRRVHHDISRARVSRSSPLARLNVACELLRYEAAQTGRGAEPGWRHAARAVTSIRAQS